MNDTHPEMQKRFDELMMSKSGSERALMGFSMFEFARILARAAIEQNGPVSSGEMRRQLFLRFYGNDFDEIQKEKILACLARR